MFDVVSETLITEVLSKLNYYNLICCAWFI